MRPPLSRKCRNSFHFGAGPESSDTGLRKGNLFGRSHPWDLFGPRRPAARGVLVAKHFMKKLSLVLACVALAPTLWAGDITAIFGTGNPNTGWTISTNNGLTLGLRAKNRVTGSTVNDGAGNYSFATAPAPRGLWNYEFSIDSGNSVLTSFNYVLKVDTDASAGVSLVAIDPLTYWWDNSFGTASTLNGQGTEGPAAILAGSNSIAQNSQNITFGDYPGGALTLSPDATYRYELLALDSTGATLASVHMNVIVGQGGAATPDAGSTLSLLGAAMIGLVGFGLRHRRAPKAS